MIDQPLTVTLIQAIALAVQAVIRILVIRRRNQIPVIDQPLTVTQIRAIVLGDSLGVY